MTITKRECEKVSRSTNSLLELVRGMLQSLHLLNADRPLQARYVCDSFACRAPFYAVAQLAFADARQRVPTRRTGVLAGGLHEIRAAYAR